MGNSSLFHKGNDITAWVAHKATAFEGVTFAHVWIIRSQGGLCPDGQVR